MSDILKEFSLFAPAKVNLHLKVLDRRKDGFHNIESLFLNLDFGDFLNFKINDDKNIKVVMESNFFTTNHTNENEQPSLVPIPHRTDGSSLSPIKDNIIKKAVNLFKEKTGFKKGITINVDKRIPIGGGLGGGSSDAASTLLALNKIAGSPLKFDSLLEAAASLGSDVPFFMHETAAAWVTGRGEIIEPVDMPKMFLVLVNPGFSSDTATAFRLLDKHKIKKTSRRAAEPQREDSDLQSQLTIKDLFGINKKITNNDSVSPCLRVNAFSNDFLEIFPEKDKLVYKDIISDLREQGAVYANLSGSGSTCFGIFYNEKIARLAEEFLMNKWQFVIQCGSFNVSS